MTDVKIKKARDTKKCVMKRKIKFENYQNCLEATKLENKMNYLEKNEINIDSIKKDHEEFTKRQWSNIKNTTRFKSERHIVFTDDINKITLSSNDDKRTQWIDLIQFYAYGTSKYLVSEKEEFKCNNIIKRYEDD